MGTMERLSGLLPDLREALLASGTMREVRLRAGKPIELVDDDGRRRQGAPLSREQLAKALMALMDYSVHAHEEDIASGYFTLEDGCRVGLCGRANEAGKILGVEGVGSACVRLARQVKGCADALMPHIMKGGRPRSALILSPPGLGKTTCLRDAVRQLSMAGYHVCVADERHEIAACHRGAPTLDIGPGTDVMDGGRKAVTIPVMLRAMSPRVVAADEIGGPGDGAALADARRCGVTVLATAHGEGLEALERRPALREVSGLFDVCVLLGDTPGRLKAVWEAGDVPGRWKAVWRAPGLLPGGASTEEVTARCAGGS